MTVSVKANPPNCLVAIAGSPTAAPRSMPSEPAVAATRGCVVVGCMPDCDGPTEITMGQTSAIKSDGHFIFDGMIDTPNRIVAVWTVEWRKLLEASVPATRTRVRVWVNRLIVPDEVIIGLG